MIIEHHDSSDPFSDDHPPSPTETLPDYTAARSRSQPSLHPPSYVIPRPSQPLTYTFSSWSSETMFLVPPQSAGNRSPVYTISVNLNLNPFAPLSYITTVRRGAEPTAEGPVVGEFEIAIAHSRATVTIGDYATRLRNVLTTVNGSSRLWRWRHDNVNLHWDCRTTLDDGSPMCVCSSSGSLQLASFVPPPIDASPPLPDATLTVFPDGHQYFDDILLSALVVERKMTLAL